MNTPSRIVLGVSLLLLAVSSPSVAQSEGEDRAAEMQRRNDCRLASQIVRTGHPAPRRAWALARLPNCPEEGPGTIAGLWVSTRDTSDIENLMRASMRLRDGRLYSQIRETAADRTRPAPLRVAGMLVLAKYVNAANGVSRGQLTPRDTTGYIWAAMGSTTHRSYDDGAVPLPSGYGREVLALLERLAASRSSEPIEVWYAAEMLRQRVEFDLGLGR